MSKYEDSLWAIRKNLQEMVADRLDVNKRHIDITMIATDVYGEDSIDEDECGDEWFFTYYYFQYRYRADLKSSDYGDCTPMIWCVADCVTDEKNSYEVVKTIEETERCFEDARKDPRSMWYEGDESEEE